MATEEWIADVADSVDYSADPNTPTVVGADASYDAPSKTVTLLSNTSLHKGTVSWPVFPWANFVWTCQLWQQITMGAKWRLTFGFGETQMAAWITLYGDSSDGPYAQQGYRNDLLPSSNKSQTQAYTPALGSWATIRIVCKSGVLALYQNDTLVIADTLPHLQGATSSSFDNAVFSAEAESLSAIYGATVLLKETSIQNIYRIDAPLYVQGPIKAPRVLGVDYADLSNAPDSNTAIWASNNCLRNSNGTLAGQLTVTSNILMSQDVFNRKLVLYSWNNNDHEFYGFGVSNATLRYQLRGTGGAHVFYAAASATASTELARVTGAGQLAVGLSNPTYALDVNGDGRVASTIVKTYVKTLGNVVGAGIDICKLSTPWSGGYMVYLDVVQSVASNSTSKCYIIPVQYNATGGAWREVTPLAATAGYYGNNWTVDINVSNTTCYLRLRRTAVGSGVSGSSIQCTLRVCEAANDLVAFTAWSTVYSNLALPTVYAYDPTSVYATASNLAWASNAAYDASNLRPCAEWASNLVKPLNECSNAAFDASNLRVCAQWASNLVTPLSNCSNAVTFASNAAVDASNLRPCVEWSSNAASFASNCATYACNLQASASFGSNLAPSLVWTSNAAVDGSNSAYFASNAASFGCNTALAALPRSNSTLAGQLTITSNMLFTNTAFNRKLVMYSVANNDHQWFGQGINTDIYRNQISGPQNNFVWYAGSNTTTSTELARLTGTGRLGIGKSAPAYDLDVAEARLGGFCTATFNKTVTNTLGDGVNICTVASASGGFLIELTLAQSTANNSLSRKYTIPVQYNCTSGAWRTVYPTACTFAFNGNNIALDAMVSNGTCTLRLWRSYVGTGVNGTNITCVVSVCEAANAPVTIADSIATYTGLAETAQLYPFDLSYTFSKNGHNHDSAYVKSSGGATISSGGLEITSGNLSLVNGWAVSKGRVDISNTSYGLVFWYGSGYVATDPYWRIEAAYDKTTWGNMNFIVCSGGGASGRLKGYIESTYGNGDSVRLNFTGQHRCCYQGSIDVTSDAGADPSLLRASPCNDLGKVVVATGQYRGVMLGVSTSNIDQVQLNESLPVVALSGQAYDKRCFGVVSGSVAVNQDGATGYGSGFVSMYPLPEGDPPRIYVNSLGEGAIRVCSTNGNVENGDYLATSPHPGYAMRQAKGHGVGPTAPTDDALRSHTIAKVTCDIDWDAPDLLTRFRGGLLEDGTTQWVLAGCVYCL